MADQSFERFLVNLQKKMLIYCHLFFSKRCWQNHIAQHTCWSFGKNRRRDYWWSCDYQQSKNYKEGEKKNWICASGRCFLLKSHVETNFAGTCIHVYELICISLDKVFLIIIHQSMLYELLSNLIGLLLLYYDFILH